MTFPTETLMRLYDEIFSKSFTLCDRLQVCTVRSLTQLQCDVKSINVKCTVRYVRMILPREILIFEKHWFCSGGPDVSCLDFFFRNQMKEKVYDPS